MTGAAGFVGARLVQALLDRGCQVTALLRTGGRDLPLEHARLRRVHRILPDLGALDELGQPSVIYHLAAAVDPAVADDEALCRASNTDATEGIGRWALELGSKLVFTSSVAAMGFYDAPGGVDETAECRPTSHYGKSKLAAEAVLDRLREDGLAAAILRPPTVYGPGERYNFLTLTRAIARRRFFLVSGGRSHLSLLHVDNLVAALLLLSDPRDEGLVLVADGAPVRWQQVAASIAQALGRSPRFVSVPEPLARLGCRCTEPIFHRLGRPAPLSSARLRTVTADFGFRIDRLQDLGYRPVYAMQEGIDQTIAWYRANDLL